MLHTYCRTRTITSDIAHHAQTYLSGVDRSVAVGCPLSVTHCILINSSFPAERLFYPFLLLLLICYFVVIRKDGSNRC